MWNLPLLLIFLWPKVVVASADFRDAMRGRFNPTTCLKEARRNTGEQLRDYYVCVSWKETNESTLIILSIFMTSLVKEKIEKQEYSVTTEKTYRHP